MNLLFVHQNFPGQFKHVAQLLDKKPGYSIRALAINDRGWEGKKPVHLYQLGRGTTPNAHPWTSELEAKLIRGEAAYKAALALKIKGYEPDLIVAHPGWGETLFIKEVWPRAKLLIYCEFYYSAVDINFDPEFLDPRLADPCRLRVKNMNSLLHFDIADAGLSPTAWQRNSFPEPFRKQIRVIHEGIDTQLLCPNPRAEIRVGNRTLSRNDQVVTFINRNLEPYRGYHIFMRTLPQILAQNPKAVVLIVGDDGVSYGKAPPDGTSWKSVFLNEVKSQLDPDRVFFLGRVSYVHFKTLMQITSAHVYLTYPFVLSWSMLEAMSCGAPIIGSRTPPVEEVIRDGENGLLVDFFSTTELSDAVTRLLNCPEDADTFGHAARQTIVSSYDLKSICLPETVAYFKEVIRR